MIDILFGGLGILDQVSPIVSLYGEIILGFTGMMVVTGLVVLAAKGMNWLFGLEKK